MLECKNSLGHTNRYINLNCALILFNCYTFIRIDTKEQRPVFTIYTKIYSSKYYAELYDHNTSCLKKKDDELDPLASQEVTIIHKFHCFRKANIKSENY